MAVDRNPHCVCVCVGDNEDLSGRHGVSVTTREGVITIETRSRFIIYELYDILLNRFTFWLNVCLQFVLLQVDMWPCVMLSLELFIIFSFKGWQKLGSSSYIKERHALVFNSHCLCFFIRGSNCILLIRLSFITMQEWGPVFSNNKRNITHVKVHFIG